jgi:biotin carboxyl carrier protein
MSVRIRREVVVTPDAQRPGEILLRSPGVGTYGSAPLVGEVLVGGSRVGRLKVLGRTLDLILPTGTTGRVAERALANRQDPVGYGEALLRLVPVEALEAGNGIVTAVDEARKGLPEGSFGVFSPSHGMFYRRSGPDAPPYVEVGQVVESGATLALVEVMKCFSAITYGGEALPARGEITDILAVDGSEVAGDQLLFVVKPA